MSAVAADLIAYLDPSIAETAGTDLFEGAFTELPPNQVVVDHIDGGDAERSMGPSLQAADLETAIVEVRVRNESQGTALTKAQAIHVLLDNLQGHVGASTAAYPLVEGIDSEPSLLGTDSNHRWVYGASYEVRKVRG